MTEYYIEYECTDNMSDYDDYMYAEDTFESLEDLAKWIEYQTTFDKKFKVGKIKRIVDLSEDEESKILHLIVTAKEDRVERQRIEKEEREKKEAEQKEKEKEKREKRQYELYLELKEKFEEK